jgi:hypothetical protein
MIFSVMAKKPLDGKTILITALPPYSRLFALVCARAGPISLSIIIRMRRPVKYRMRLN